MKYTVVIEKTENNYGAYVPDLPGCVAVAETQDELMGLIKEAMEFHIESMQLDGEEIPEPTTMSVLVEV